MDAPVLIYVAAMSVKRADVTFVERDGMIVDLEDVNGLVDPLTTNLAKPEPKVASSEQKPEPKVTWNSPHAGLTLYINCRPVRGVEYVELEALLAPMMAKVAEATKADHYTLVDYGKGPAMVAAMLSRSLPSGAVVVDTRLPSSAACLEVLRPLALVVVEGMGR